LFCGTVCKLRPVFGVQLVLFVGVAVADVEVDVVAGVVLFVSRDGVPVAPCVWRSADAVCRRCGGRRGGGRRGGGGAVCSVGWYASCGLCLACSGCYFSMWRRQTLRVTWWRGWCCMFRGTVCKLRLVFGLQLVLFGGVAVADVKLNLVAGVVPFVPRDSVQVAACAWRAAGAIFLCGGGRHGG